MKVILRDSELEISGGGSAGGILSVRRDIRGLQAIVSAWNHEKCFLPVAETLTPSEREKLYAQLGNAFPHEYAALVMSSGSTGTPKLVAFSRENFAAAARAHSERYSLGPDSVWLASLPFYTIGGLSVILRAAILGQPVAFPESIETEDLRHWMMSGKIHGLSLVPTQLQRLIESAEQDKWSCSPRLKTILIGGAHLPDDLKLRARALGFPVLASYGMTETCAQVWSGGRTLPNVELRLGKENEVEVKTPALAQGLWSEGGFRKLPLTSDGFYRTGDIAEYLDERGFKLFGRKSELINTGGVKVSPLEVEEKIREFPGIEDVCVLGIPNPEWGEKVVAAVVTKAADLEELREFLSRELSAPKRPKEFFVLKELPKTNNGKIIRHKVRELLHQ